MSKFVFNVKKLIYFFEYVCAFRRVKDLNCKPHCHHCSIPGTKHYHSQLNVK